MLIAKSISFLDWLKAMRRWRESYSGLCRCYAVPTPATRKNLDAELFSAPLGFRLWVLESCIYPRFEHSSIATHEQQLGG
jgi:hypothetical protein